MSKTTLIHKQVLFKLLGNITIDQIKDQEAEYANKIQSCCFQHLLAIGTEKGRIHIFDINSKKYIKTLYAEPWLSTLDNCRGMIWTSGMSRSLLCIRIKDNKKIFHTNCDTDIGHYDGIFNPKIKVEG